jgi:hypothetical protein
VTIDQLPDGCISASGKMPTGQQGPRLRWGLERLMYTTYYYHTVIGAGGDYRRLNNAHSLSLLHFADANGHRAPNIPSCLLRIHLCYAYYT